MKKGKIFKGYKIIKQIGKGTFAKVYLVENIGVVGGYCWWFSSNKPDNKYKMKNFVLKKVD